MGSSSTNQRRHQTEFQLRDLVADWRQSLCKVALVVACAAMASSAPAQFETSWTNLTLGDWFIASNWNTGIVPVVNKDVDIVNGGVAFVNSPGAECRYLSIGQPFSGGGLIISNGGTLYGNLLARIGTSGGASASVTVNGAGSRWDVSDWIEVATNGTLRIENGANVESFSGGAYLGASLTITGAGSTWRVTDGYSFDVGTNGAGLLNISNGGALINSGWADIGGQLGSSGTATVTGTGSFWNNAGNLYVGSESGGAGALRITDHGVVQAPSLRVASTGSVEVNNGSSTQAGLFLGGSAPPPAAGGSLGSLIVANTSSGRMIVTNGGVVRNHGGAIGQNGYTGTVLVEGAGSLWANSSDFFVVGDSGVGTLEIRNGGAVSNVNAYVALRTGSSGTVVVSDPGSSWTGTGSFYIGDNGTGSLQVFNGGRGQHRREQLFGGIVDWHARDRKCQRPGFIVEHGRHADDRR